jgi:aminopeptidase-like protein
MILFDHSENARRESGAAMHGLMARLRPFCASITGDGIRGRFAVLAESLPLALDGVASGEPAFDWTIPPEWNVREAWIRGPDGRKVVDLADSPLQVVGYSVPVRARLPLSQLRPHLHSLPEHPDWIPYRASYYAEAWGFCLRHDVLEALPDGEYEVLIDSSLAPGRLEWAECVIPGTGPGEVLVSAHACHPAMCNDNLSGVVVGWAMARALAGRPVRHTYRFLFIPTIIGSIAWLSRNEEAARRVRHGLVLACIGDAGPFTYKQSRRGDATVDRAAAHVIAGAPAGGAVEGFVPYGYDERNYCSPGFDLPVGVLSRTPHGRFPQYHTSGDDLDFVRPGQLAESLDVCLSIVEVLENDARYLNLNPKCEPQLGRRGLYGVTGGLARDRHDEFALFWVLNLSDGRHSLLDIAERARLPFGVIARAAQRLEAAGLLAPAGAAFPPGGGGNA